MTRWERFGVSLCALVALVAVGNRSQAELITFDVIPAFAPKGPDSPSWNSYVLNAIAGIQSNTDVGSRATNPAAYERVTGPFPPSEIIYTPFPSWRGTADPNPAFVAPFDGELGNRVHFGLHVVGESGWKFALDELTWALDSDDDSDLFDAAGSFAGATYSATRVGLDYGPDNKRGGGDDEILRSGEVGSREVNELIYVGVGDGFFSENPMAPNNQADIDLTLAELQAACPQGCDVNLTATYTLPDHGGTGTISSSATATIAIVPEPSTAALAALGMLAGCVSLRRRRS